MSVQHVNVVVERLPSNIKGSTKCVALFLIIGLTETDWFDNHIVVASQTSNLK
jgi:hypothetical protein